MAETLEDKVNSKESKGFMKKAFRLGFKLAVAGATTALSLSTVGTLGVLVGGAFASGGAIGNLVKGKSLFETVDKALTTYSSVNAVIHPIVWLGDATFPLIPNVTIGGKIARALYASTLYNVAFLGSYKGATHLIDNYFNPVGITKSITNNFYNEYTRIGLGFLPGYALAANGVNSILGLPTFAWNALPLGFYNSVKPYKTEKTEVQLLNPFYLANSTVNATGKVYRDITTAASDLGASVRNILSKTPVTQAQTNPA